MERLHHALDVAKRSNWLVALLFIDLDGFRAINDTLGHESGDLIFNHCGLEIGQTGQRW
jgi:diguanylate cyclase (GGDEF)-like protein